jgi:hypothetical protein
LELGGAVSRAREKLFFILFFTKNKNGNYFRFAAQIFVISKAKGRGFLFYRFSP